MKKTLFFFSLLAFMLTQVSAENLPQTLTPVELPSCSDNTIIKQEVFIEGIGNVDVQEIADKSQIPFTREQLPASFDATEKGWITPVKNQRQYGTCWAFSLISAMETNMIKKGYETNDSVDYSELHLSYFSHNLNQAFGDGENTYTSSLGYYCADNYLHAAQHLAGWQGAAQESDYPYPPSSINYSLPEEDRYTSVAHLQNYMILPNNLTAIKKAILEHGSVSVSYYDNNAFYSSENAYYQNNYTSPNHAVTIVGWDDNYALSNFDGLQSKPSSPGAWKIKNSWGSVWGDDGYFWLSYEDSSLSYFAAFDVENADNYHILHQYDGADVGYYFSGQAAANIFTAEENQTLNAVGFYTFENNIKYNVEIYKLNTSYTNPTNGILQARCSGTTDYHGYHTINLNSSVPLKKGDVFSVILKLSNNLYPFEGPKATSKTGESFLMLNNKWHTNYAYNSINANNACIKAYSSKENFTVSFDSTGGSNINPTELPVGSLLDIPAIPQKTDCYFAGWYKDFALTQEWDFEKDTVTENTTLYAKWSDTPIPVESIVLFADKSGIYVNETLKINAKFIPYYATDTSLSWTCSDKSISDGKFCANEKGTYVVTATSVSSNEIFGNYTVNVYEPLKNIQVQVQKPVHKTTDKIPYSISVENAVSCDFYIETPGQRLILQNAPKTFALNYTYTEGEYKIYAVAYDALGNTLVSDKKTFWVTNNPMLIVQKNNGSFRIGGYNNNESKIIAAYYNGNQLISATSLNALDKLASLNDNTNATTLKLFWWNSANNMTPVIDNITIQNPATIPAGTIITQR